MLKNYKISQIERGVTLIVKNIVLLGDGMADYPLAELGDLTPLQYANTPNMDKLALTSRLGMVKTIPEGYAPGSDVANLSVIGYDPKMYYTGRSPLEAASMGIELAKGDIAFRCNLVTLGDELDYENKTMLDYCAGEISSPKAKILIDLINQNYDGGEITFYPGISYRHLMLWRNGKINMETTPPHDIADKIIGSHLPTGDGADILLNMMKQSYDALSNHPINVEKLKLGEHPANSIWLWGQGTKPNMPSFQSLYGLKGAMISAVDLTKGLALSMGLEVIEVPGATGNIHTNFSGKAQAALRTLYDGMEFVYIHVEAPDEAGHQGSIEDKIKAIEAIDNKVLGELMAGMNSIEKYKLILLPDHPTPLELRTHTAEPVPFMIFDSTRPAKGMPSFDEISAKSTGLYIDKGDTLMNYFINKT